MHPTAPDFSGREEALILPLRDDHIDAIGFDPRSHYAETFWLQSQAFYRSLASCPPPSTFASPS